MLGSRIFEGIVVGKEKQKIFYLHILKVCSHTSSFLSANPTKIFDPNRALQFMYKKTQKMENTNHHPLGVGQWVKHALTFQKSYSNPNLFGIMFILSMAQVVVSKTHKRLQNCTNRMRCTTEGIYRIKSSSNSIQNEDNMRFYMHQIEDWQLPSFQISVSDNSSKCREQSREHHYAFSQPEFSYLI